MRKLIALFLTISIVSCSGKKGTSELNGKWIPIEQGIGGTQLPESAFSDQYLLIEDNKYTVQSENLDKGTVTIDGNRIDIHGQDGPNAGKTFKAIYKLENEQLTICYNLNGDSYPQNFSTAGNGMFFMAVFKRAK